MHCLMALIAACIGLSSAQVYPKLTQPQQVHISYSSIPENMTFTWVTINFTRTVVEWGKTTMDMTINGSPATLFTDGGSEHRTMYVHRVTIGYLTPGIKYIYHVGSPDSGWSDLFSFTTMKSGNNWSPTFAIYGDLGNKNAQSLPALQEEAQRGTVDAILHVGDFAYDMDTDNARFGDAFMNQIQPVAAYIPYMVCPGNHEAAYNFSNYKNRFSMPGGDGHSMFWSFNIGPAHIVNFNTEVYYPTEYGSAPQIEAQYNWLENDLKEANKKRDLHPWIIVMGHRPMYCSTNDGYGSLCNNVDHNPIRTGQAGTPSLEDLFYKYGVDLQFYAHEHSYERLWPVYNKQVCNGTKDPYTDPGAPVHIVTGAGGNQEGQSKFDPIPFPWSAFRSDDFGYTKMKVINGTHLSLDQVSTNQWGAVIDKMMLVKNKHGLGTYTCHINN